MSWSQLREKRATESDGERKRNIVFLVIKYHNGLGKTVSMEGGHSLEDNVQNQSRLFLAQRQGVVKLRRHGSGYLLYLRRALVETFLGSQDERGERWVRVAIEKSGKVHLEPAGESPNSVNRFSADDLRRKLESFDLEEDKEDEEDEGGEVWESAATEES